MELLTGVLIGSVALLNLKWGVTGDRVGHKAVAGGLMMAKRRWWPCLRQHRLAGADVLLEAGMAGEQASSLNSILSSVRRRIDPPSG